MLLICLILKMTMTTVKNNMVFLYGKKYVMKRLFLILFFEFEIWFEFFVGKIWVQVKIEGHMSKIDHFVQETYNIFKVGSFI